MLILANISPDFWTARFVNALVLCLGVSLSESMTFQSDGWRPSLLSPKNIFPQEAGGSETDTVVPTSVLLRLEKTLKRKLA